jgi:hypothetical protein
MKGSGKTSAIFQILKNSISSTATVYIFCATATKDNSWIQIIKWLKKRVTKVRVYKDISQLADILEELENPPDESSSESDSDGEPECSFPSRSTAKDQKDQKGGEAKKPKPPKSQENFFIFDDLGEGMKNKEITHLCSNMRHFKSMVIMSAQSLKYILPSARDQVNYWLLYPHIRDEIIEEVYKAGSFRFVTEAMFDKLYRKATAKDYNFLYASNSEDGFRFNFNEKIVINK